MIACVVTNPITHATELPERADGAAVQRPCRSSAMPFPLRHGRAGGADLRRRRADRRAQSIRQQHNAYNDLSLNNHKVTYRGAAEFDLAPRSLLYASVETGYRSGGFSVGHRLPHLPARDDHRLHDRREESLLRQQAAGQRRRLHLGLQQPAGQVTSASTLTDSMANFTQNIGSSKIKGVSRSTASCSITPTTLVSAPTSSTSTPSRRTIPITQGPGAAADHGLRRFDDRSGASAPYLIDCSGLAVVQLAEVDAQLLGPADHQARPVRDRPERRHPASQQPLHRLRLSAAADRSARRGRPTRRSSSARTANAGRSRRISATSRTTASRSTRSSRRRTSWLTARPRRERSASGWRQNIDPASVPTSGRGGRSSALENRVADPR